MDWLNDWVIPLLIGVAATIVGTILISSFSTLVRRRFKLNPKILGAFLALVVGLILIFLGISYYELLGDRSGILFFAGLIFIGVGIWAFLSSKPH